VMRSDNGAPRRLGSTRVSGPGQSVASRRGGQLLHEALFDKGAPRRQESDAFRVRGRDQMSTLLVSQPNFESHATPSGHPERADRIRAVEEALGRPRFASLVRRDAPGGDLALADLVHAPNYLQRLRAARP